MNNVRVLSLLMRLSETHVYIYSSVFIHVCIYICMYICVYIDIYMYVYMCVYICVYIHTYKCLRLHQMISLQHFNDHRACPFHFHARESLCVYASVCPCVCARTSTTIIKWFLSNTLTSVVVVMNNISCSFPFYAPERDTCIYIFKCMYTGIYIYIYVCMCICVYIDIYTYMYVYMCVYTYMYLHTHINMSAPASNDFSPTR